MTPTGGYHQPVMADEAVGFLVTRPDGVYIDATAGDGSHTLRIFERLGSSGKVLAIDRDDEAVARTARRLEEFSSRLGVTRGEFSNLKELAAKAGIATVDGILFDLGISSYQIDSFERGFSYRGEGPLDLRMNRHGEMTAAEIVNSESEADLARILFEYGEERNSRRIAAAIVRRRARSPLLTTADLATVITSVTNPRYINKTLSRVFQALRIVVNDELNQLQAGLQAGLDILRSRGRVVVIAYHSLEDRIVKNFFRQQAELKVITKKPVGPSAAEITNNPRARSARMRAAEKI